MHAAQEACPTCKTGLTWVRSLSYVVIKQVYHSAQVWFVTLI